MKPGDMVTWKQRPDLRGEGFPPYHRLGLILQCRENQVNLGDPDFEVLWLESQNTNWHNEAGLELVNESSSEFTSRAINNENNKTNT